MDSYSEREERGSCAKRPKLDVSEFNAGVLCDAVTFSNFPTPSGAQIDSTEGFNVDCDSGYEASTLSSMPTPSNLTSPHTDPTDFQECLPPSETDHLNQLHNDLFALDTSQDSIEADDDNASTVSNLSELSGISELSGHNWKPMAGSMAWIKKQMASGVDPRALLIELGVELQDLPASVDDLMLWKLIINMLAEPPRRHKLRHVNTIDDVVRLLKGAKNVIVLTGAGVSVSCGIPDFRSKDGIYSRLAIDFPDLPDPQAMFDINYFINDPRPFFKFAKDIYPGKFKPSPCHRFIKLLERHNKLLRNYTQNIDTLEKVADIQNVIECHGSFATATCTKCQVQLTAEAIRDVVLSQNIPICQFCQPEIGESASIESFKDREVGALKRLVENGIMKPDIVFFGEGLPDTFHEAMAEDKNKCDLLVVIGSSLKVRPVALIPSSLPANVPQILINREPLPDCHFDVELLGDCDGIINHICQLLGNSWSDPVYRNQLLKETVQLLPWIKEDPILCPPPTIPKTLEDAACKCSFSNNKNICDKKPSSSGQNLNQINHPSGCVCTLSNQPVDSSSFEFLHDDSGYARDSIKERHESIDSARDSGIGDNSNFMDGDTMTETVTMSDMRGYWQPKEKRSIAERLPKDSFYLIPPSRYIFPGAEVYYDPDNYLDNSSSSDSTESESEQDNLDVSF
ncbi:NAD-dependent protein deacetylase sirtuin-1 [Onthophagus taurus]|uniref:NAD-dependent protein deacetylase sirtuin-1 n=1 Tax=Onthophagus taurus TaxID=166361 RepID=UPI000C20A746|nr:NAD-dependent protein deacetylase sirtuin-1 [Onthophagus taurus]